MNTKVKHAGVLIFFSYMLSQGIRLAANLIVARLLAPEMFGLMAVVYTVQQGIAMFSDLGLNAYVVRHKDYRNQTLLNTIWTIQVARGWLIFILFLIFSLGLWFLQQHAMTLNWGVMNDGKLPTLIAVVSFASLFNGYKSLAQIVSGRELNRLRIETAELIAQLAGTLIMIGWAYYAASVWALASAALIGSIVSLSLSYLLFDIKHQFELNKEIASEVYHFGKWIFMATALTFLAQQGDRLFLSINISAAELGLYSIAFMLAGFLTTLINRTTDQLWIPVFSQQIKDKYRLRVNYYRLRFAQDSIVGIFVIAVGFIAPYIIDLIYDERYRDIAWMLQLLVLSAFATSISSTNNALLISIGETKSQMQVMVVKLIVLLVSLPLLFSQFYIKGILCAVAASNFFGLLPQYIHMRRNSLFDLLKEIRVTPLVTLVYGFVLFIYVK